MTRYHARKAKERIIIGAIGLIVILLPFFLLIGAMLRNQ